MLAATANAYLLQQHQQQQSPTPGPYSTAAAAAAAAMMMLPPPSPLPVPGVVPLSTGSTGDAPPLSRVSPLPGVDLALRPHVNSPRHPAAASNGARFVQTMADG